MTGSCPIAHTHLLSISAKRHQKINQLIMNNGLLTLEPRKEEPLFDYLVKVVTGQQLSNSAAKTIYMRVRNAADRKSESLFDLVCAKNRQDLLDCGLSRFKVRALLEMKDSWLSGNFELCDTVDLSHEIVSNRLTSVWGFGQWSADMVSMFYFGFPDTWSEGDSSLSKGIIELTGVPRSSINEVVNIYSPFRTYLALHVWKGLDDGLIK